MTPRIPLDSPAWVPESSDNDNPVPLLKKINAGNSDADDVYNMLDGLCRVDGDGPITQFFYAVPYLLDVFEKTPDKYAGPIQTFCMLVRGLDHLDASNQSRIQLDGSRDRILKLICQVLSQTEAGSNYCDVQILLSGIANLFGHTDLGHQLTELTPDTEL